jgi:S1-C subfamily serine protease
VDVALLEMQNIKEGEVLPTIPLGDSGDIMIGETILAIGNPFGPLIADPRPSVSAGVVSAVARSFKPDKADRIYHDMIQSDAAINPGNSGGPLVNLDGEAIGINTFILSNSGGSDNVGFSIPINRAKRVVDEILRFGKLRAIRLDFEARDLTPYVIQVLNLKATGGALIWSTDIGGPAQKAGLEPGDVIVAVNDKKIASANELISSFLTRTVDEHLRLTVMRQDKQIELQYVITEGNKP